MLILIEVDEGPVRIDIPDAEEPVPGVPGPPAGRGSRRASFADQHDVPADS